MKKYIRILLFILMFSFTIGCIPNVDDGTKDDEDKKEEIEENGFIQELFGNDVVVYTNEDSNPYNIDLDKYGSDVYVIFYEPNLKDVNDEYRDVNQSEFYANYEVATSYEDSYYRSRNYLMSGEITDQTHIPVSKAYKVDEKCVRATTATYVLDTDGDYIAYIPNTLENERIIFYGGGYITLNDVAAYLLAFGEVPANSMYHKNNGRDLAVRDWGKYGRVNYSSFSGDVSKYPYEPLLPTIKKNSFCETDFGTLGDYANTNSITGTTYYQKIYNDGKSISRGAARFVFTCDEDITSIDERYVFYTYNHYNDFEEYLNYDYGWGIRFGNESAGNEYCSSKKDYEVSAKYEVTKYPETILKKFKEMIN